MGSCEKRARHSSASVGVRSTNRRRNAPPTHDPESVSRSLSLRPDSSRPASRRWRTLSADSRQRQSAQPPRSAPARRIALAWKPWCDVLVLLEVQSTDDSDMALRECRRLRDWSLSGNFPATRCRAVAGIARRCRARKEIRYGYPIGPRFTAPDPETFDRVVGRPVEEVAGTLDSAGSVRRGHREVTTTGIGPCVIRRPDAPQRRRSDPLDPGARHSLRARGGPGAQMSTNRRFEPQ